MIREAETETETKPEEEAPAAVATETTNGQGDSAKPATEEAKVTGGTGCSAEIFVPDPEKADQTLIAALAELSPTEDAEVQFPAVGAAFAEEARVTCPAP